MPASNAEIVRRGFEAMDNLDMDAVVADWSDDVVWDVSDYDDWPAEQTAFRGAAEILTAYGQFMAGAETLSVEVHEVIEVDDERVLAVYTETRRAAGADEPQQLDVGILYTLRGGRIVHMAVHSDHARARRAAGLA